MKALPNLRWSPSWVSHLGCVKGCLDYLGIEINKAWLYGGTGHAFVINMAQDACPSGPTAWNTTKLLELGQNLGYTVQGVTGHKSQQDLAQLQQQAWAFTKTALDQGRPCYGWELDVPGYYVIYGCDDTGYYYSGPGCDEGKGPKPWQELGDTGIGWVEVYSVAPGEAADDATTVREALAFALEHAQNPAQWIQPGYRAGLEGFDRWAHDVEAGTSSQMGLAYNAAVWEECRRLAVDFLQQARQRLGGGKEALFDQAIAPYQVVAGQLKKVTELYPFQGPSQAPIGVDDKSQAAAAALQAAREAEAAGLQSLEKIVQAL